MVSGARRLIGSGIAYLLFGLSMLYLGLCAWGVIESGGIPKSNFFAMTSVAIGIFDLIIGARNLFSWAGRVPIAGIQKSISWVT